MIDIQPGQIWRDKDKRREKEGSVRTFRVVARKGLWVQVENVSNGRVCDFLASRFGSDRANDSFERVK